MFDVKTLGANVWKCTSVNMCLENIQKINGEVKGFPSPSCNVTMTR